jgi:hypothetical protein
VEAVLPVKCQHVRGNDLARAKLLLASINANWRGQERFRVHIVTLGNDLPILDLALDRNLENVEVVTHDENLVVSGITEYPCGGWVKQQVLKLAAHKLMQDPLYLCLDSDLVCCKPIDDEWLLPGGRAMTDRTQRHKFPAWWYRSSEILDANYDRNAIGMAVTPQFLSTKICQQLEEFLVGKFGVAPWSKLMDPQMASLDDNKQYSGWTEYTLYSLFAEKIGLMDQFHLTQAEMSKLGRRLSSLNSLWGRGQFEAWQPHKAFTDEDPGTFLVCQSNTDLPIEDIIKRLNPFVPYAPRYD